MATLTVHKLIEIEAPPKTAFSTVYDYDSNGNLIYQGWAFSGQNPATSAAVWSIKKFNYTLLNGSYVLTSAQWAKGSSSPSNVWANRTTLSYQ